MILNKLKLLFRKLIRLSDCANVSSVKRKAATDASAATLTPKSASSFKDVKGSKLSENVHPSIQPVLSERYELNLIIQRPMGSSRSALLFRL